MSRVLLVTEDPRSLPSSELHWWRQRLTPNEDGIYYVIYTDRVDVDSRYGKEQWEYGVWAGYVDYFDGRDDWSFPYKARLEPIYESCDLDFRGAKISPIAGVHLDVLAGVPPNFRTWRHLGRGIQHPDDPRL